MAIITINGEFYARPITGIERVARECVAALDDLLTTEKIEIAIPQNAKDVPTLKKIKIIPLPHTITFFPRWTQGVYQRYIIKNRRLSLDFSNVTPFFSPGIAYIHDIYAVLYRDDYKSSFRDKLVALYSRAMYKRIAKHAKRVITVSNFSKKTIVDHYHIDQKRISVVPSGYKPILDEDISILERFPSLKTKDFFFTLGSISKRKNLKWIIEHAKLYPKETFAISGKRIGATKESFEELPQNLIFLGYLSDGEVRSLFKTCRAFIFPSYFEGFGIPPLEALSAGCRAIVSKSSCLPEIYGTCVNYIDPDEPNIDLQELLKENVSSPKEILQRYTLFNSAKELLKIIKDFL